MRITRTQWPVGQGGFASGVIESRGKEFVYVYDCGSTNIQALRDSINALMPRGGRIDALFISHLDADHCNGIEYLLSKYKVDSVFLPYLDNKGALLALAEAVEGDGVTRNLFEMITNSVSWLGQRGVKHIYLIHAAPEDDWHYSNDIGLDGPLIRRSEDDFESGRDERRIPLHGRGPVLNSKTEDGVNSYELDYDISLAVSVGSEVWALIPFVHPVSQVRLDAFAALVESSGINVSQGTGGLLSILTSAEDRKTLKSAYRKIHSDHNCVSMSLYSGPIASLPSRGWYNHLRHGRNCHWSNFYYDSLEDQVGWLGTGDANFRGGRRVKALEARYSHVMEHVGTLMCPHHGSRRNYSSRLLNVVSPEVVFAPVGKNNGYKHPHKEVVGNVLHRGKVFLKVTEKPSRKLIEIIEAL